jgi:hypothetical protein
VTLSNNSSADPALRAGLARELDPPPDPDTLRLAEAIARAFGGGTAAIIHYGSHAQRSGARPESAHDFFVIVDQYAPAYRHLHAAVGTGYSPGTAAALARVLPPNVVRIVLPVGGARLQAKCAVLTGRDLARLCSPRAPDHFTQGRLFQQVQLVWARDAQAREATVDALVAARVGTFWWGRPYLPPEFDVERYCRTLLETSFAAEIRPEANDRVTQLLAAQGASLARTYGPILEHFADTRLLVRSGKSYRLAEPVTPGERRRVALHFARSKARATARWAKYVALYEAWLDYIVQKIARRSGQQVELTERERRWPLIFLWPRAIEFIRTRPQRRGPGAA